MANQRVLKEKQRVVEELAEKMKRAQTMVFTDFKGLTVSEITNLRKRFRAAEVEFKVVKNTLALRAAQLAEVEGIDAYFDGPTAIAFSYNDPVIPSKIIADFIRETKKAGFRGGVLQGKSLSGEAVSMLANLPSRQVLLSQVAGMLQAPITGLVRVLNGPISGLAIALDGVKKLKEEAAV